jgi:hypothetical protein
MTGPRVAPWDRVSHPGIVMVVSLLVDTVDKTVVLLVPDRMTDNVVLERNKSEIGIKHVI